MTMSYSEPSSPLTSSRQVPFMLKFALVGSDTVPHPPRRDKSPMPFVRSYVWPIFLVVWTLVMAMFVPMTVNHFGGSVQRVLQEVSVWDWPKYFPTPQWWALGYLLGWSAFQAVLMRWLPGPIVKGPVTPEGEQPEFHDNGKAAWVVTHLAWLILGPVTGILDFGSVFADFGTIIATNNAFGVPFTLFLYWKGRNYPSSRDAKFTTSFPFDFFQGVELHPRIFGLSLKQLLNCRISMMGWSLAFLCFAEAQYDRLGYISNGMFVTSFLVVIYLMKFFWWETGYFTSIDVAHDRCGYYIVWGLLTWVPTTYCSMGYVLVDNPADWSLAASAVAVAVGLLALWINWDADHQRQHVRAHDGKVNVWGKPAKLILAKYTAGDGKERTSLLLYSGYWGLARHFHYVPELTLAFVWSLPAGLQMSLSWLYFAFLFCLLVDRASRDEEKCSAKYGKYWVEYRRHVPYKILPFVY